MLRSRRTLSNLDPIQVGTKALIGRTIQFVPFSRKGLEIRVIL